MPGTNAGMVDVQDICLEMWFTVRTRILILVVHCVLLSRTNQLRSAPRVAFCVRGYLALAMLLAPKGLFHRSRTLVVTEEGIIDELRDRESCRGDGLTELSETRHNRKLGACCRERGLCCRN